MRVSVEGDKLTMVERATGRDLGTYQLVPAGDAAESRGAQALATCADVRSAPATATRTVRCAAYSPVTMHSAQHTAQTGRMASLGRIERPRR